MIEDAKRLLQHYHSSNVRHWSAVPAPGIKQRIWVPPAVAPAPRLKVTAEQEYIIREIILKDLNVQKQNSVPEAIGDFVPDEVKPYPLPPEVIQKVPRFNLTSFS